MFLEKFVSSKTRASILNLFFLNPKNQYYLRQIETLTNITLSSIQYELKNLLELGILINFKDGNRLYFTLNENFYLYNELKNVVIKSSGIAETFKLLLEENQEQISFAFIYGSYAKGTETITSDIDIFIIGSISLKELYQKMNTEIKVIGREINFQVYSPEEFEVKYSTKHHFINEIISTTKIFIIGTENEFAEFIKSKQTNNTSNN